MSFPSNCKYTKRDITTCLHIIIWSRSIGLSFGNFRHPQKSLEYSKIGFYHSSRGLRLLLYIG